MRIAETRLARGLAYSADGARRVKNARISVLCVCECARAPASECACVCRVFPTTPSHIACRAGAGSAVGAQGQAQPRLAGRAFAVPVCILSAQSNNSRTHRMGVILLANVT